MADETNTNVEHTGGAQEPGQEKTFTQADVDSIVNKRLERERKKYPGEEELTAFRAWKDSQQTEKERWDSLTHERDESRAALAAAQAELEQYRREKLLLAKGIPAEDADYYAFKIGKLVTDELPFEKAAEQFLKENRPGATVTVDTSASLEGGSPQHTPNETMNSLLRGLRK